MKKMKTLALVVVILTSTLFSCTDNNSIEKEVVAPSKSLSLRAHLSNLKKNHNISEKNATEDNLTFVFPLTLSYTNGSVVTVESMEALLALLENENETVYINGVAFPLQVVTTNGNTTVVTNEDQYDTTLDNNDIDTVNDVVTESPCFDFTYPLTVIDQNNQPIVVNTETELLALANSNNQINFSYPLLITTTNNGGGTLTIANAYGLLEFNCD